MYRIFNPRWSTIWIVNFIQVMDLIFRAKDHEVASYETEQIVDVPGAEDMQSGGKPCTYWLKCFLL